MNAAEKPQVIIYTILFVLLALIVLVLTMSGCVNERIEGNHDLVILKRSSLPFNEVVSSGSFNVKIIPSAETRIEVKGESNILPHLSTYSNGTTLTVQYSDGYNIREHYPVEVFLYTPVLQAVRLSGSGVVECGSFSADAVHLNISGSGGIIGNFESDKLDADISGSGNMTLEGIATNSSFNISGSGNIFAQFLDQEHCNAGISGSGNVITKVAKTLNATISGSGSLFYLGNPVINTHISGSGNVLKYQGSN
jgi:hypothetical protein